MYNFPVTAQENEMLVDKVKALVLERMSNDLIIKELHSMEDSVYHISLYQVCECMSMCV